MSIKFSDATNLKFVNEYKKHECLWNFNLDVYKNKKCREEAYKKIEEAMNLPGLGTLEIKTKIKNLRSTYAQELKKIEESKSNPNCENVYVPNLIWFPIMKSFLLLKKQPVQYIQDENDDCHFHYKDEEVEISENSILDDSLPTNEDIVSSSLKRRKINGITDNYIEFRESNSLGRYGGENEFDVFGKHVASQLKRMSTEQALLAMEQIQSYLTQSRLQDLHKQEVLI